jgi:hypothetical protein
MLCVILEQIYPMHRVSIGPLFMAEVAMNNVDENFRVSGTSYQISVWEDMRTS